MTKLDEGGTAIWHDQSSRIQWPPEAPLRKAEPYSARADVDALNEAAGGTRTTRTSTVPSIVAPY